MKRVRVAGALLLTAVTGGTLTGCSASVSQLRHVCADVTTGTSQLTPYDAGRPQTALAFAIGRFGLLERAVSRAHEEGLPAADASALRTGWLDPATTSLARWTTRLEALRVAVEADDPAAIRATYGPALAVGTEGVDAPTLRRLHLASCAAAFTPPAV